MKKNYLRFTFSALTATALIGSMASCGGNSAKQEDSLKEVEEMIQAVETTPDVKVTENKYGPEFFSNEALRSETPSDSTYVQTESGLKYVVVTEGSGKSPKGTDKVTVHYTGMLLDGTVFDSSVSRGTPATFPLTGVIPGWTEGLQYMKEGGKTVFYIPSAIAYGPQGTPDGSIPPNAPLIFEVELLQINY